jgi:hypothetical protein
MLAAPRTNVNFPLLLKAKLAVVTPIFMLGGFEKAAGIEIYGLARFRKAMRSGIALMMKRCPEEEGRIGRCLERIIQAPVSVYGFQANPGLIYVRYRSEFGPIDWAGTLVHAAVHSEQYRKMRRLWSHEDAIIALCREEQLEREAQNAEVRVVESLGIEAAEAYLRSRGADLHTYFGISASRKSRRDRKGTL